MTHRLRLLAAFAALSAPAVAAELDAVPGVLQANFALSTRQAGMGNVGTGGDDVLRAWANPAALAGMSRRGEVALFGGPVATDAAVSGLGAAWRFTPAFTAGVMTERFGYSFRQVDEFGDTLGNSYEHTVTAAGATGAFSWNSMRIGLTVKVLAESLEKDSVAVGCGDLGVQGTWGAFTAGVSGRNLGGKLREGDVELGIPEEELPTEVRLGGAYRHAASHVTVGAEISATRGRTPEFGLGGEWWFTPMFALRLGAGGSKEDMKGTAGLSVLWEGIGFDYAAIVQGIGAQHRASLSWAFGPLAGGAPEPVAEESTREEPVKKQTEEALPPPPVAGAKKLNFAIADLRAENVSAGDAAVMADLLRSELVKTGTFNVIEKQNMDKVLAEHAFQQTGCSSEECAVKLGKLLNVQRMAVGSFGKLLDSYFLNIRVVDIETGQVAFADSAEGKTVSDLKTGVRDLARRLAKQIR